MTATFTITRTTNTGILEYYTGTGFKSQAALMPNEKMLFTQEEGSKKVTELRRNCRLPRMAKSIILNYY